MDIPAPATVRIDVATEHPYPVLVGRGVRDLLPSTVRDLGAAAAVLVHQPALAEVAEEVRAALEAVGVDAHRVEIPDAEEGKALAVAGYCWEVCGRVGLTRQDVVISLGGGAATDLAGFIAATAYGRSEFTLPLGFLAGALVTAGAILIAIEHHRVMRVETLWWAEHPGSHPRT